MPLPRNELARYVAPVLFLAAVTVAVLLIRAGLGSSGEASETTRSAPAVATTSRASGTTIGAATTKAATTSTAGTTTSATTTEAAQFYTVQSGDTLGGIAIQFDTTVSKLLELNPGVDPRALHSGQRVRVG
jgi:LysM repeat protein